MIYSNNEYIADGQRSVKSIRPQWAADGADHLFA